MKLILRILLLVFFVAELTYAQGGGKVIGKVTDCQQKTCLKNVLVKIQNMDRSVLTDPDGNFIFNKMPNGKFYLIFVKKGYYSLIIPDVEVSALGALPVNVEMVPGNELEYLFVEIGGIQVTADRELLEEEAETTRRISSGEIEHMQANSLADVLSLIPGNEKSSSLGLQKQQSIAIRAFDNAADDQAALFGTRIVVDDVPLTNNADLQTGVGVNYGSKVESTSGKQYDLREIVAENIEKVEVMAGASSVEYGDHSQGLILVQTRTKNVPTRFKFKTNPDTREANLMGSFSLLKTDFVYNFNYGYSERDIRVDGDEYHRVSGSLNSNNDFLNGKLNLAHSLKYSRKIEEDNDESDPYATRAYNRDHHITYSNQFNYDWNDVTHLYIRNYVDFKRRNSWKRKLETPDVVVWTDRETPGTQEGIIPEEASYFSEVLTRGNEWSYGSKIKVDRKFFTGEILHRFLIGAEFQTDDNTGPGKTFDLLKPPNGFLTTRPRSFSDTPGTSQFAFFADDRITGDFMLPYTLNFGLRIDSYNPTGISFSNLFNDKDIFKADQGSFFNPRMGLKIKLAKRTQMRFTFSKSSKIPSLSSLYPENYYLDVQDFTTATLPSGQDTTITLISTYMYDLSNPKLKGYQNTKFELGIDQQVGDVGLSLVTYSEKTTDIPRNVYVPFTYYRYEWPNWPDSEGKIINETITTTDSKYELAYNLGWTESSGIEFSLRTHRIKSLNMRFHVNAAFNFAKYGSKDYTQFGSVRYLTGGDTISSGWVVPEDMQFIPYYKPYTSWRQKMVINYNIDYIAKPLGIWLTFKAQQVLWDKNLRKDDPVSAAQGYYSNGALHEIDAATSEMMGLDRTYDPLDISTDSRPNDKWIFSIVASKSLYRGAEISLFVENIFDDKGYYKDRQGYYRTRNPEIFWGIAFSTKLDGLF